MQDFCFVIFYAQIINAENLKTNCPVNRTCAQILGPHCNINGRGQTPAVGCSYLRSRREGVMDEFVLHHIYEFLALVRVGISIKPCLLLDFCDGSCIGWH